MDKVTIVFWSQSGNTESMANAVAEGVTAAGKEAVVVDVASASLDDLKAAKGFAMGCIFICFLHEPRKLFIGTQQRGGYFIIGGRVFIVFRHIAGLREKV